MECLSIQDISGPPGECPAPASWTQCGRPFGGRVDTALWLADGTPAPVAAASVSLDCGCSLAARVAITPYRLRGAGSSGEIQV